MKLDTQNEMNAGFLALLPHWKCHKVVQAGRISLMARDEPNGMLMVHAEPSNMPFAVPLDFLRRHHPEIGGYFTVYEDGYISYSPAAAFEAGYSLIIDNDSNGTVLTQNADGTESLYVDMPAAVTKASALLRDLDAFIPMKTVTDAANGATPAQQLKSAFLEAWRKAEGLAYEYSHSLPEGDERNYAMDIYHRVRLLFSNGKSGITQDAGHVSERDDRNDLIMELQLIGEDYGCPGGMNRFAWLRARLDTLARLEKATSPVNQDGADFSDALVWLKNGEHVRRRGWNGKGLWLEYIEPHTSVDLPFIRLSYPVPGNGSLPYPDGARVPWAPSQTDMLATDWELAD